MHHFEPHNWLVSLTDSLESETILKREEIKGYILSSTLLNLGEQAQELKIELEIKCNSVVYTSRFIKHSPRVQYLLLQPSKRQSKRSGRCILRVIYYSENVLL